MIKIRSRSMIKGGLVEAGDFGAFEVEFGAVGEGVGEDCHKAAGALEQATDGPRSEGEGFSGLAAPHPDLNAVGAVFEGFELIRAEQQGSPHPVPLPI